MRTISYSALSSRARSSVRLRSIRALTETDSGLSSAQLDCGAATGPLRNSTGAMPTSELFKMTRSRKAMVGLLLVTGSATAYAQDPAPVATSPAPDQVSAVTDTAAGTGDIVVTGSRITRNGYDQPTPVTVIGAADIQAAAPANIADFVNQIPSVSGSVTPANSNRQLSSGAAGVNTVNLRSLGSNRTLVLLDGHRSVGSTATGTVDINTIPQGLVKSVEVVTGGASSVYGSDAVAGVVNFILDRTYTGIKGEVSYGETTYGDDETYRATMTGGFKFADGRGHILINGDLLRRGGIYGAPRAWASNGMHLAQNPAYTRTNGQPELLPTTRSGLNVATGGGIITAGPLRGTYFGPGGVVNQYNYGENYNTATTTTPWTVGGDYEQSLHYYGTSLQPEENVTSGFGRVSYNLFDDFEVFGELTYNRSKAHQWGGSQVDKANVSILSGNPFIPAAVQAQMTARGLSSITIGTWNADIPTRESNNTREVQRYLAGFQSSFGALGVDWKIDGYYQKGITNAHESLVSVNRIKLGYAQDAVRDSTGKIVCRVTRNGSTDPLAAGCVPFNRMGVGVNSQAGVDYIIGAPYRDQKFQQDVAALNFNSNIANPWLDPIGIAFGIEHRKEQISGNVPAGFESGWIVGNFLATNGAYTVTEGYLETLVPLPLDFEFNGAARYTHYSESGNVVTWKAGLTWEPIDDLRLRVTRSRDIRAPNLSELFQAGSRTTNSLGDPWQGNTSVRYTMTVTGNLDLDPEKADTLGLGAVYRPSFLPGFGLSADYWDIKINGAISTLSPQQIIDRCRGGNAELCARLQAIVGGQTMAYGSPGFGSAGPGAGVTEFLVLNSPYNFVSNRARGLDFEASYQFDLDNLISGAPGSMTLRAIATRYLEASQSNGVDAPTDAVGENSVGGPAKWIYRATLGYTGDNVSMQIIGRGLSSGVYNNDYVECTSSCPATNAINRTISNNRIAGAFYLDTYMSYKLPIDSVDGQIYFRVANLLNKDPAKVGKGPSDSTDVETGINQTLYDYLGRSFRVGLRFNLG
jgi:iron complex outermembrane receptor protein